MKTQHTENVMVLMKEKVLKMIDDVFKTFLYFIMIIKIIVMIICLL